MLLGAGVLTVLVGGGTEPRRLPHLHRHRSELVRDGDRHRCELRRSARAIHAMALEVIDRRIRGRRRRRRVTLRGRHLERDGLLHVERPRAEAVDDRLPGKRREARRRLDEVVLEVIGTARRAGIVAVHVRRRAEQLRLGHADGRRAELVDHADTRTRREWRRPARRRGAIAREVGRIGHAGEGEHHGERASVSRETDSHPHRRVLRSH